MEQRALKSRDYASRLLGSRSIKAPFAAETVGNRIEAFGKTFLLEKGSFVSIGQCVEGIGAFRMASDALRLRAFSDACMSALRRRLRTPIAVTLLYIAR